MQCPPTNPGLKGKKEYNLENLTKLPNQKFDAIILGVSHNEFLELDFDNLKNENAIIYDVKGVLGKKADATL